MKKCLYCGRENADEAVHCRECGTEFELPKSASETFQSEIKTATIRLFGTHEAAAIAAANLEPHGIDCWTSADDCGGMQPALTLAGGVRLHTRAADAADATALLDAPEIASLNQNASNEPARAETTPRKFAAGQLLIGLIVGLLLGCFYQGGGMTGKHISYHYGKNGMADEAWVYQDGHLIEQVRDRNHDGKWDYWSWHDGHGNITKFEEDNNFDGKLDETGNYSNGDLVSVEKDTDFNGTPDEFYTYSNGLLCQVEIKPNGSSYTTVRKIYENSVLAEEWRGGDSNGNFREIIRYDPYDNPIGTNIFHFQNTPLPYGK